MLLYPLLFKYIQHIERTWWSKWYNVGTFFLPTLTSPIVPFRLRLLQTSADPNMKVHFAVLTPPV